MFEGGTKVKPPCFVFLSLANDESLKDAPIAQLDRASVYGTEGYLFESDWVYFLSPVLSGLFAFLAASFFFSGIFKKFRNRPATIFERRFAKNSSRSCEQSRETLRLSRRRTENRPRQQTRFQRSPPRFARLRRSLRPSARRARADSTAFAPRSNFHYNFLRVVDSLARLAVVGWAAKIRPRRFRREPPLLFERPPQTTTPFRRRGFVGTQKARRVCARRALSAFNLDASKNDAKTVFSPVNAYSMRPLYVLARSTRSLFALFSITIFKPFSASSGNCLRRIVS